MMRQEFLTMVAVSPLAILFGRRKQVKDMSGCLAPDGTACEPNSVFCKYYHFKIKGTWYMSG
ncbi:hypothetical protein LCGC14_2571360 [marine sediment metagenome]|uniref:Uncharacterized protein n=1 Tax=marine sediment metagenome TaxID=412755 RepID=A0A0F9AH46_9ZZZZ